MRPPRPMVAIFLNPTGIEAVKLIPQKPYSDTRPMAIYEKVADLIEEMNNRLKQENRGEKGYQGE
jgi:hypothetical protein